MAALLAGVVIGALVPTLREGSLATGLGGGTGSSTGTVARPGRGAAGPAHPRPSRSRCSGSTRSVSDPGYLRAVALDQYDAENGWSMSNLDGETSIADDDRLAPLPLGQAGRPVRASIRVLQHDDRFLPAALLAALGATWRTPIPTTGASTPPPARCSAGTSPPANCATPWRRRSHAPRPPSSRAASPLLPFDEIQERFTVLPELDPSVTDLVASLTGGAGAPYERVRRIHDYLTNRSNGFIYSLSTEPGTSGDDLVDFLRLKRGYCEQYAGTMAVMVRAAGVPARVALGYTPGSTERDGTRLITSDDAHAWVEVYFDDLGWVPFDPTPIAAGRRGRPGLGTAGGHPGQRRGQRRGARAHGGLDHRRGAADRTAPTRPSRPRRPDRAASDVLRPLLAGAGLVLAGDRAAGRAGRDPHAAAAPPRGRGHGGSALGRAHRERAGPRGAPCIPPGRRDRPPGSWSRCCRRPPQPARPRRTPSSCSPGRRRRPATGATAAPAWCTPTPCRPSGPSGGRMLRSASRRNRLLARWWPASLMTGRGRAARRADPGAPRGAAADPAGGPHRHRLIPVRSAARNAGSRRPGGRRLPGSGRKLLVVAAAEPLLEPVLQRLATDPATAPGASRARGAGRAGGAAGLDGAGRGLVVEDAEGHAREGDQEAQDPEGDRPGDGAADQDGEADDDQDGADLQFAARLQPAVTGAYGRGELGIVVDEGALDLLQQTLLVLGERHVDLQVGGARAVGGLPPTVIPRIRALGNARKATVRRAARTARDHSSEGRPGRGDPARWAGRSGAAGSSGHPGRPGRPPQQRRGTDRAGTEAAGGAVGGQLGVPPAELPGAQLQLLRRRAGVHQPLGPNPHQADPGPVEPEGVEQRPRGVVELLPDVGGDVQGAAAGDGGEVGEADLDADGARQPADPSGAGPPSARRAAGAPGGSRPGRRRRCRRSPRAPMDFSGSSGTTRRGSRPQDSSCRCGPAAAPSARCRVFAGTCARSPTVRSPSRSSASSVFAPTPHRAPTGSGCRKSMTSGGRTTSRPSGLARGGGELGDELGGGDADRAGDPLLVEDPRAQVLADLRGVAEPAAGAGDVEERLVECSAAPPAG